MPPALGEDSHQLRRHHSGLTMVLSVRGRGTEAPLTVGGGRLCARPLFPMWGGRIGPESKILCNEITNALNSLAIIK